MTPIITTTHLGRRYGDTWALRDLNLSIDEGSIFGLLGANGAGKTTTLRILTTSLAPSAGRACVGGSDVATHPRRVRRVLGYMPDSFGVYDDLTVLEYLDFYATAHGVGRGGRRQLLDDLLSIVGLTDRRSSFVDVLSRGMKQRLGIARCLVHDPPILLLDEPASGLDPLARMEMQTLLRELSQMGKTVVISSHILPELGDICTHAAIVHGGCLLLQGSVAELLAEPSLSGPLQIRLVDELSARLAVETLRRQPAVTGITVNGAALDVQAAGGPEVDADLFVLLGRAGCRVLRYGRRPVSLEDVYFAAVRSSMEAA